MKYILDENAIIHKRRKPAWHRNNLISPCGIRIKDAQYPYEAYAKESYKWGTVTCAECLKFMSVFESKIIKKFNKELFDLLKCDAE